MSAVVEKYLRKMSMKSIKKDGEDAYSAAQASETIDEYMNGPYGKCGTVSEVTKKTEASNVEYKAAKIITKKAWTENYLTNIHVILPHKLLKFMVDNLK